MLYDKYHEAEFARLNLDVYLPDLYRSQSELIAIFLCPEYVNKKWCGLELRSIRQLISTPEVNRIMLLSFGPPGDLSSLGILDGDGSIDILERTPQQVAQEIVVRHGLNQGTSPQPSSPSPAQIFTPTSAPMDPEPEVFAQILGWADGVHHLITDGSTLHGLEVHEESGMSDMNMREIVPRLTPIQEHLPASLPMEVAPSEVAKLKSLLMRGNEEIAEYNRHPTAKRGHFILRHTDQGIPACIAKIRAARAAS